MSESREITGNAVATTISGGTLNSGATSITIASATGWPTGTGAKRFAIVINRGETDEEKVLIESRSGTTLTVATSGRGYDGTTDQSHANGATVELVVDATWLQEINEHYNDTALDHHTQYLTTGRHDLTARHTFGAALGTPAAPANVTTSASAGAGSVPAREDHAHALADSVVTNAKMADMAEATLKGRAAAAGTGAPTDLTATQAKTLLAIASTDISDFTEATQDVIGALTGFGGSGLTYTYNDGAGTVSLDVNVDSSTLEINSDTLRVKDAGITLAKLAAAVSTLLVPVGTVLEYDGVSLPTQYLWADGSSVSRTTYADLWAALSSTIGTCTITIASPGVVTKASHGLSEGDAVYLTTTGALPTNLTASTTYYVKYVNANTFQLATSRGGTAINTSGSQSGTHTLVYAPHGIPAASTTNFYLPDRRGRASFGRDNMGGTAASRITSAVSGLYALALGATGGDQSLQSHTHTLNSYQGLDAGVYSGKSHDTGLSYVGTVTTNTTGSGDSQNIPPAIMTNYIIRY